MVYLGLLIPNISSHFNKRVLSTVEVTRSCYRSLWAFMFYPLIKIFDYIKGLTALIPIISTPYNKARSCYRSLWAFMFYPLIKIFDYIKGLTALIPIISTPYNIARSCYRSLWLLGFIRF